MWTFLEKEFILKYFDRNLTADLEYWYTVSYMSSLFVSIFLLYSGPILFMNKNFMRKCYPIDGISFLKIF